MPNQLVEVVYYGRGRQPMVYYPIGSINRVTDRAILDQISFKEYDGGLRSEVVSVQVPATKPPIDATTSIHTGITITNKGPT